MTTLRPPRRRGTRQPAADPSSLSPLAIVGGAHVVVGAWILVQTALALLLAGSEMMDVLASSAISGTLGVAMALAGLWLRDGRRRGAMMAAALDGLRVLLVLFIGETSTLDILLAVALLAGVVWVWPLLGTVEET